MENTYKPNSSDLSPVISDLQQQEEEEKDATLLGLVPNQQSGNNRTVKTTALTVDTFCDKLECLVSRIKESADTWKMSSSSSLLMNEDGEDGTSGSSSNESDDPLHPVSCRLEELIAKIKEEDGIGKLYAYQSKLEKKLKNNTNELCFLLKEIKAINDSIANIKKQRHAVRTETMGLKKVYNKLKQQEICEMETVAAVYDKELLRRWHSAKRTTHPQNIVTFLNSALGRKQAVEYVCKMAEERLQSLRERSNGLALLQNIFHTPPPVALPPVASEVTIFNIAPLSLSSNTAPPAITGGGVSEQQMPGANSKEPVVFSFKASEIKQ